MNVGVLRAAIRAYSSMALAESVCDGVELDLLALNNAKRRAQIKHDWKCAETSVSMTIVDAYGASLAGGVEVGAPAGGSLVTEVGAGLYNEGGIGRIEGTWTAAEIRGATQVRITNTDNVALLGVWSVLYVEENLALVRLSKHASTIRWADQNPELVDVEFLAPSPLVSLKTTVSAWTERGQPVKICSRAQVNRQQAYMLEIGTMCWEESTGVQANWSLDNFLYVQGERVFCWPTPTQARNFIVDGHKWLPEYRNDLDSDWFTEVGGEYLQWQGVVELNYLTRVHAPRLEGALSPPTQLAERALQELIANDNYSFEGFTTNDFE